MFLSRFHPDIAEEQSVPAEPGGEAEEDLHHPLLCLPHLFLLLASVQVFVFVFIFVFIFVVVFIAIFVEISGNQK